VWKRRLPRRRIRRRISKPRQKNIGVKACHIPLQTETTPNPDFGRDFFLASGDKNDHNRINKGGHFQQRFASLIELEQILSRQDFWKFEEKQKNQGLATVFSPFIFL